MQGSFTRNLQRTHHYAKNFAGKFQSLDSKQQVAGTLSSPFANK